jgi:hypothetical protein
LRDMSDAGLSVNRSLASRRVRSSRRQQSRLAIWFGPSDRILRIDPRLAGGTRSDDGWLSGADCFQLLMRRRRPPAARRRRSETDRFVWRGSDGWRALTWRAYSTKRALAHLGLAGNRAAVGHPSRETEGERHDESTPARALNAASRSPAAATISGRRLAGEERDAEGSPPVRRHGEGDDGRRSGCRSRQRMIARSMADASSGRVRTAA